MSLLKIKLQRDLRRNLLRGHPWVYKEALSETPDTNKSELCVLNDKKNQFLAWGIFDPHSVLSFRLLSTDKKAPNSDFYISRLNMARRLRNFINKETTSVYRLINGEGDLLPGLVCDVYNDIAIIQFDGKGPGEFWDTKLIHQWLKDIGFNKVALKQRGKNKGALEWLSGSPQEEVNVIENKAHYLVNIEEGQKTGFFIDQRDNRLYLRGISKGKRVLNLFSYTGGFSVNAGLGGAKKTASVDISQGAIDFAVKNWEKNNLDPQEHIGLCENVFEIFDINQDTWDMIIVDPPSMAQSEHQKPGAIKKYTEIFTNVIKQVPTGGDLIFSSCSSHISFTDFSEIINEAMSKARCHGQILRFSGQGADHPYPHYCPEMRYLKFIHIVKR